LTAGSYRGYVNQMNVGTKELKNRLSHYLRKVRDGEIVRVTDRGEVVAELRAAEQAASDERALLAELEAAGLVTAGSGRFTPVRGVRLRSGARAARSVLEDRG